MVTNRIQKSQHVQSQKVVKALLKEMCWPL